MILVQCPMTGQQFHFTDEHEMPEGVVFKRVYDPFVSNYAQERATGSLSKASDDGVNYENA